MDESIKYLLKRTYGIKISDIIKSSVGAGSDTYFVSGADGKFDVKYPSESEMNHPEAEPKLCEYLLEKGIPVCSFLRNLNGEYLTKDDQGRNFTLQHFIEGNMYEWNSAPDWLMTESAKMLGKIHAALAEY